MQSKKGPSAVLGLKRLSERSPAALRARISVLDKMVKKPNLAAKKVEACRTLRSTLQAELNAKGFSPKKAAAKLIKKATKKRVAGAKVAKKRVA